MEKQEDIVKKLKVLNSMIEDFLDKMDMEDVDEEKDAKSKEDKED